MILAQGSQKAPISITGADKTTYDCPFGNPVLLMYCTRGCVILMGEGNVESDSVQRHIGSKSYGR